MGDLKRKSIANFNAAFRDSLRADETLFSNLAHLNQKVEEEWAEISQELYAKRYLSDKITVMHINGPLGELLIRHREKIKEGIAMRNDILKSMLIR